MADVMPTAIITESSITVVVDGNTRAVNDSHPNYMQLREAAINQEWDRVPDLLDVVSAVKNYMTVSAHGKVEVSSEYGRLVVKYDGAPVTNFLSRRIIAMMNEGANAQALINFFENVKMNPSKRAADDLYEFIEKGNIPITPDGYILAYKNVRRDFTDIHSGTFDNSVGSIVEIARNEVDEDPDRTCSYGLHFCSQDYLPNFSNSDGHTVIVKVHPRDVVAFPRDYNNTKARCCRYEVVSIHTKGMDVPAFTKAVEETDDFTEIGKIVTSEEAMKIFNCSRSALRKRCRRASSARWAGAGKVEILSV